jgi:hypothetical protein
MVTTDETAPIETALHDTFAVLPVIFPTIVRVDALVALMPCAELAVPASTFPLTVSEAVAAEYKIPSALLDVPPLMFPLIVIALLSVEIVKQSVVPAVILAFIVLVPLVVNEPPAAPPLLAVVLRLNTVMS